MEALIKIPECPVCLEAFNPFSADLRPKVFPCGHDVCSVCLRELQKKEKIRCPECRVVYANNIVMHVNVNLEKMIYASKTQLEFVKTMNEVKDNDLEKENKALKERLATIMEARFAVFGAAAEENKPPPSKKLSVSNSEDLLSRLPLANLYASELLSSSFSSSSSSSFTSPLFSSSSSSSSSPLSSSSSSSLFSIATRSYLAVGDEVDAMDRNGNWYAARVLTISTSYPSFTPNLRIFIYEVEFAGWSSNDNEWVQSANIRKRGTHVPLIGENTLLGVVARYEKTRVIMIDGSKHYINEILKK